MSTDKENQTDTFKDEQAKLEEVAFEYEKRMADSEADYLETSEGHTICKAERESMARSRVKFDLARYHHQRTKQEYTEFEVPYGNITREEATTFMQVLESSKLEEDMQSFLAENKMILARCLVGSNARYVIPKPKLGNQLVPDFLIAEMSSIGIEWHGLELESPLALLCTKSGQACEQLVHSIQQIIDWRAWLQSNLGYARTSTSERGLGLIGITPDLPSTVLIGRRIDFPERFNDYRRQVKDRQNIEIHTFDWLADSLSHTVN